VYNTDAVYQKLSKLVNASQNYSSPKLARFLRHSVYILPHRISGCQVVVLVVVPANRCRLQMVIIVQSFKLAKKAIGY